MTSLTLSRRAFVAGSLAFPAIARAQMLFRFYPFSLGVAAGDPAPDGFVIWTRLAPEPMERDGGMPMQPVTVHWQVAEDAGFRKIAAEGDAIARPELAHAVHVEVGGLLPARPYFYRFTIGSEKSRTGRAKTAPLANATVDKVRLGVAGCQMYEHGYYTAYRHLAGEDLDFVFHYGDYIYESRQELSALSWSSIPVVREHVGQEIYSLDDYRRRYSQYKRDADLQAAHAAAAWFVTYDDHEVVNNWSADHDGETPPELFRLRRAAAFQAWYEHMPVRRASLPAAGTIAMARSQRYGTLLDAHFPDTRQFRTPQPCGDGFKPYCAEVDAAKASIMGDLQEKTLAERIAKGGARWNLLAQQVMMMKLDRRRSFDTDPAPILNMDSWAGYETPRARLLNRIGGKGDLVVLTGDEHQNYAGEVLVGDAPKAIEFVATSISSGGDGEDVRSGTERMLANNPGLKFMNDQRGYLVCEVRPEAWQTDVMVIDRISTPGGALSRRARFAVPHGAVRVERG
ncbi:alkaline phosphatase D family protein [Sphingomonas sp. ID0503]|uniref:alkaline phosphatase D family protein n=1 Tax=Sphingomonas sp. ID0503 TaxID=3399691 RepID=UPI003AFA2F36